MLVMLMEGQVISPQLVCQSCLLADHGGQPRWKAGQLCCGHAVGKLSENQPAQYECQMGFRVANIQ